MGLTIIRNENSATNYLLQTHSELKDERVMQYAAEYAYRQIAETVAKRAGVHRLSLVTMEESGKTLADYYGQASKPDDLRQSISKSFKTLCYDLRKRGEYLYPDYYEHNYDNGTRKLREEARLDYLIERAEYFASSQADLILAGPQTHEEKARATEAFQKLMATLSEADRQVIDDHADMVRAEVVDRLVRPMEEEKRERAWRRLEEEHPRGTLTR